MMFRYNLPLKLRRCFLLRADSTLNVQLFDSLRKLKIPKSYSRSDTSFALQLILEVAEKEQIEAILNGTLVAENSYKECRHELNEANGFSIGSKKH